VEVVNHEKHRRNRTRPSVKGNGSVILGKVWLNTQQERTQRVCRLSGGMNMMSESYMIGDLFYWEIDAKGKFNIETNGTNHAKI